MANDGGVRIIFSVFLGLMLTAFVGIGTYTFHPPPDRYEAQIRELDAKHEMPGPEPSPEEREQLQEMSQERQRLTELSQAEHEDWRRTTSIILIIIATLVMVLSVIRKEVPVITNGLLLGGIFTMLYGVGWIISDEASVLRFVVIAVAFAITVAMGYVRFVRQGAEAPVSAPDGQLGDLEERVAQLEDRMERASQALQEKR